MTLRRNKSKQCWQHEMMINFYSKYQKPNSTHNCQCTKLHLRKRESVPVYQSKWKETTRLTGERINDQFHAHKEEKG